MMANSAKRPLQSRENRGATSRLEETVEAASPEANANSADDPLAEARRLAEDHGMVLTRQRQPRRVRPEVQGDNKVRTTCYFSPQVRHALDLARLELNMHMSDIIDVAVIDYLQAQGLQVEGLTDSQTRVS